MDKQHCSLGLTTFRSLVILRSNLPIIRTPYIFGWDKLVALGIFRGDSVERFVPTATELAKLQERDESAEFW